MVNNLAEEFVQLLEERVVVVDTSSLLLTGPDLLAILPKCKLVIPSIVVSELEGKRSHTTVGFLAREWLRLLEELRVEHGENLAKGVPAPSNSYVSVRVEPNNTNQERLPTHLRNGSPDSTILAVAKNLDETSGAVTVLSNDAPMRLKATLDLGLDALEYNVSRASAVKPFNGREYVQLSDEEYVSSDIVNKDDGAVPFETVVSSHLPKQFTARALVSVQVGSEEKSVAELVYNAGELVTLPRKARVSGVVTRTVEQDVAVEYLRISPESLPIVSLGGGAGTGKTLLSVATGLDELDKGHYQKIVVFRSLHEMGRGQELGFLPGDLKEKMEVWGGAIYDALDFISGSGKGAFDPKSLRNKIEISPITYLRGRSLSNSYIILEEAQNFSRSEILNIMSRAGEGTKLVLTSDPNQVDNKFLQSGANADIWSVIDSLKNEDLFAHITLTRTERSKVAAITSRLLES